MRFLFISLGVICLHMAMLAWVQVNQQPDQTGVSIPIRVQTRQIEEPTTAPQPMALPTKSRQDSVPLRLPHEVSVKEAAPAKLSAPSAAHTATTTLNATSLNDTEAAARSEKSTSAAAAPADPVAPGRAGTAVGVQSPSANAEYLNNPPPPYPALSLRLNEKGKVVVRVLIGNNGQALEGNIVQSSGYDRLDQAALRAVLGWRYVPGKVDGQAKDMWFDVPINFKPPN